MKTTKSSWIALFGALLVLAGSVAARAQATQQAGDQSQADPNTAKKDKKETKAKRAIHDGSARYQGRLPRNKERMRRICLPRQTTGRWNVRLLLSFAIFSSRCVQSCACHFSRRMTSPWPTNWSFSHRRYLYVAALLPGRGGPLSSRMPAGA